MLIYMQAKFSVFLANKEFFGPTINVFTERRRETELEMGFIYESINHGALTSRVPPSH